MAADEALPVEIVRAVPAPSATYEELVARGRAFGYTDAEAVALAVPSFMEKLLMMDLEVALNFYCGRDITAEPEGVPSVALEVDPHTGRTFLVGRLLVSIRRVH